MRNSSKATGIALALAAAGLIGSVNISAAESSSSSVHCYGVNKCRGHNDCKTARNSCQGHGSCRGKGFLIMPSAECAKRGGTAK